MKKNTSLNYIPKTLIFILKIIEFINPNLTTMLAAKIFTTPIKHNTPQREKEMDDNTFQKKLFIPKIKKEIVVYEYGDKNSIKSVLLVHGWSGRGTQLYKIADEMIKNGYKTISFDAPAHGKSSSKTTLILEFIECILELDKIYSGFEIAIGHSLGGMALLNAKNYGLRVNKIISIGAGNSITEITKEFVVKLNLKPNQVDKLITYFEKKYNLKMEKFSSNINAKEIYIPVLIIHDENDIDVSINCAFQIKKELKNGILFISKQLGHRKILYNQIIINKIQEFIK